MCERERKREREGKRERPREMRDEREMRDDREREIECPVGHVGLIGARVVVWVDHKPINMSKKHVSTMQI